jgi:hypothetical protein
VVDVQYPTLPPGVLAENLDDLLNGVVDSLSDRAVPFGGEPALDGERLAAAIEDIRHELDVRLASESPPDADDDQFEGAMAVRLFEGLQDHPIEVLDDPTFWSYLAAGPLWFLVRWRENPRARKREVYHEYLDGRVNHACVPLRMYLRAAAVANSDLASQIPRGTDFWRSHVIRVKTGAKQDLARSVAEQQRDARMPVTPLREYAKRINRRWSNQVIHLLDEEDCRAIAEAERRDL